jgi:hypothetical protein
MSTQILADTSRRFNSNLTSRRFGVPLSFAAIRNSPVENTVHAYLYQGRGFTPKELEAIKRHEFQRWRIRPWDRWKSEGHVWVPEDFCPESLQCALGNADRVLIHLPDPGPGVVDAFEEDWDHHRLQDDDGGPLLPKCTVSLSFPLPAMDLWRPILRRWAKPGCPVGLPHHDENGGFDISNAWGF